MRASAPRTRRNKYHAKRTLYNGRWYGSKFEAKVAADLEVLRRMGIITSIEPQYSIDLCVNGVKIGVHRVDFYVRYVAGNTSFIEAKGVETPVYKLKKKIVEAMHPEIKYEVRSERKRR